MNRVIFAPRTLIRMLPALLVAIALAGCMTTPKIDWPARVGNYTYDQAVMEFGPPDKSAKLSDGTTVAEWLTQRARTILAAEPYFPAPGPYFGPPAPVYSQSYFPARYLRLIFGADGRLKAQGEFAR